MSQCQTDKLMTFSIINLAIYSHYAPHYQMHPNPTALYFCIVFDKNYFMNILT